MRIKTTRALTPLLVLGMVGAGCDALSPDDESRQVGISFQVANATQLGVSANVALTSSSAALTIDSAQLVLANIKLHRHQDGYDDQNCGGEELPRCGSFSTGPVIVNLPVGGGKITPFSARPTVGTYDWLEFRIVPREVKDSAFFAQNPNWPRTAAVRVMGNYNGRPFDVYLGTAAEIREDFDPPIVINDSTDFGGLGVTVTVDVASWFDNDAAGLIDPQAIASNSTLRARVERNITASFNTGYSGGGGRGSDD